MKQSRYVGLRPYPSEMPPTIVGETPWNIYCWLLARLEANAYLEVGITMYVVIVKLILVRDVCRSVAKVDMAG